MDPFDDFEFKPLTEGLGFHPKKQAANQSPGQSANPSANQAASQKADSPSQAPAGAQASKNPFSAPLSASFSSSTSKPEVSARDGARTKSTQSTSQSISDLIASLPPSLDFEESAPAPAAKSPRPQIYQPFAREEYKAPSVSLSGNLSANPPAGSTSGGPSIGPTIGQMLPTSGAKVAPSSVVPPQSAQPLVPAAGASTYSDRLNASLAKAFPHSGQTVRREIILEQEGTKLTPVTTNFAAAVLDGMVITGLSTILLVSILAITKINLVALLNNAQTDVPTQLHLVLLFFAVLQMYMLTARSFFGASLGEWAFDMQLGTEADRKNAMYPIRVAWRSVANSITGLLALPILSLIMKRDVMEAVGGLQLYRRS